MIYSLQGLKTVFERKPFFSPPPQIRITSLPMATWRYRDYCSVHSLILQVDEDYFSPGNRSINAVKSITVYQQHLED